MPALLSSTQPGTGGNCWSITNPTRGNGPVVVLGHSTSFFTSKREMKSTSSWQEANWPTRTPMKCIPRLVGFCFILPFPMFRSIVEQERRVRYSEEIKCNKIQSFNIFSLYIWFQWWVYCLYWNLVPSLQRRYKRPVSVAKLTPSPSPCLLVQTRQLLNNKYILSKYFSTVLLLLPIK